jgi:DtxR family Mn-dependent transcriptional regulator
VTSSTVENYLRQLYLHEHGEGGTGPVATGQLADSVGVTAGTATAMLKALANSGLVEYETRRGARLTPQGERLALHVLRRHRLVELFLVRTLGMDWSIVHEEAELLEHAVSDRVLDAIDTLLGNPTTDPHGDPIPVGADHVEAVDRMSLANCAIGQPCTVSRILNQTLEFLQLVQRSGLTPDALVTVLSREMATDAVVVRAADRDPVSLSLAAGGRILVRPVAAVGISGEGQGAAPRASKKDRLEAGPPDLHPRAPTFGTDAPWR